MMSSHVLDAIHCHATNIILQHDIICNRDGIIFDLAIFFSGFAPVEKVG